MSSIHGHEVLQMMLAAETPFTTEQLITTINIRFGNDARFHTYSASDMTAEMLVQFLARKGKFVLQSARFTTHASKICQH
ncbi:YecH family protein [Prodigiosinella aquatilis]|nr:YecH family metal-binding protein [Prodigiosinella sp. LS101]WJV55429.1 YecH family protein [Prodigiosinella sp. LS101]WJV59790.1 YecH family protein [Pectobacteriaceae bacterium C111]